MFIEFFFLLRQYKVPVSLHEWLSLLKALELDLMDSNLDRFYTISRAILVKDERYYDMFDQCFLHFFKGAIEPTPVRDEIMDWLNRTPLEKFFSKEELDRLQKLSPEELEKMFQERLGEQKKEHHGGNRWIGTGGTSPFGHGGFHPSGIRVGGGAGNRMAMKVAADRKFKNYRHDLTLDTRQIQVALKKLRYLKETGPKDLLDLDATIDQTCRNAGDIDLIFKAPRKNQTKILLLMDVGGTMDPYAHLVSLLFSALHSSTHLKDFQHFYFHNCVYKNVFRNIQRSQPTPTGDLMRKFDKDYKLVMVGDAWMGPYELYYAGGQIDFYGNEPTPGIAWLQKLKRHFPHAIWLNPERKDYWGAETIQAIHSIFPMFPLTIEGLTQAVDELRRATPTY